MIRNRRSADGITQRFFTIIQVADALGVSPKTVSRRIATGELRHHRIGRQVRISEPDFASYVAMQRASVLSG